MPYSSQISVAFLLADVPVSEPCPRMESAGGRQPGVDNPGLVQPQERVPSRLRENKPSVHLGFAQGGCTSLSFCQVSCCSEYYPHPTTASAPYLLHRSQYGVHTHVHLTCFSIERILIISLRHVFASDSAASGAKTDRYDSGVLAQRSSH